MEGHLNQTEGFKENFLEYVNLCWDIINVKKDFLANWFSVLWLRTFLKKIMKIHKWLQSIFYGTSIDNICNQWSRNFEQQTWMQNLAYNICFFNLNQVSLTKALNRIAQLIPKSLPVSVLCVKKLIGYWI